MCWRKIDRAEAGTGQRQGNPRVGCEAGRETDARTQTEAAPDEHTELRCRPANQSLITDVSSPVPSSARTKKMRAATKEERQ